MIVPEFILQAIFDQLPGIRLNDTTGERAPKFGHGDRFELTKYLLRTGDESYPLIWLLSVPPMTDEEHKEGGFLCDKLCELVIATRETNKDLLALERFQKSFKYVLAPLCEYVVQGLEASQTTRIHDATQKVGKFTDYSYQEARFPGDADQSDAVTIDLWDAIKLSVKVEFNNNCQNTIKWKTVTT